MRVSFNTVSCRPVSSYGAKNITNSRNAAVSFGINMNFGLVQKQKQFFNFNNAFKIQKAPEVMGLLRWKIFEPLSKYFKPETKFFKFEKDFRLDEVFSKMKYEIEIVNGLRHYKCTDKKGVERLFIYDAQNNRLVLGSVSLKTKKGALHSVELYSDTNPKNKGGLIFHFQNESQLPHAAIGKEEVFFVFNKDLKVGTCAVEKMNLDKSRNPREIERFGKMFDNYGRTVTNVELESNWESILEKLKPAIHV